MNADRLATQPQEFRNRRRRLMDSMTGGAIVIAAGHDSARNNDVDHQYRQESSFWYLTGFDEPDAVAVLRPGSDTPYTLFVRPYDPTFEIWVGRRAGVRGAVGTLGANAAYPLEELDSRLPQLLAEYETIYYALGSDDRVDGIISGLVKQRRRMAQRGAKSVRRIEDPTAPIDAMRQVKTDEEIALLQRAIDITAVGFEAAMQTAAPGVTEYEVQAALERQERHDAAAVANQRQPRRYDELVRDGLEDNADLVDASAALDRSWDAFREENPRGCGNKRAEPGDKNF